MPIDPRALKTYLAVCRENSISAAARFLNLSQPSVSTAVANLEESLQAHLFDRTHSGIILSPEGEILRRRSEALEVLLRDTEQEIGLMADGVHGPLRVGGTPGALVSLVPHLVSLIGEIANDYSMQIIEKSEAELSELLRNGVIDFAIVTTEIDEPEPDLIERTLFRDPFALIVGHKNDGLPDSIELSAAIRLPWVMPAAAGGFRRQIDALFIASKTPLPRNVIRCDSLLTTKAIVRSSEHVTILPNEVVASEIKTGDLRAIKIKKAPFSRSIGLRMLKDAPKRSALSMKVVNRLLEQQTGMTD